MKQLSKQQIYSGDGETLVWVYDGDVDYRSTGSLNYKYYCKGVGNRTKTRPYNQYSAMTNRCIVGGAYQSNQPTYIGVKLSEDFSTFDKWCAWAEKQVGYMWTTDNGRIWQMDKDLLMTDEMLYSPDTVCFIPDWMNSCLASFYSADFMVRKRMINRMFDELFDVLDEKVIEKLLTISEFNYGINKEPRMTVEQAIEIEIIKEKKNVIHNAVSPIKSWNDSENIMQSVVFNSGYYTVNVSQLCRKLSDIKTKCVREAVLEKLRVKIELLESTESRFVDSEFWFSENFHKVCFDKLCELSNLEYRINKGEIKLQQWVQVEV